MTRLSHIGLGNQINMFDATNLKSIKRIYDTRLLDVGEYARNESGVGKHL